ncbi:fatty acid desaturase CarF family protein [Candidatus Coxiella mudrowiae]|uniref:fatty acid desaturase CarF family protein n=1 Tax=Candidatus Coxiella mudrowiae TaxID=2054173 RepID=UPI0012FEEE68
MTYKKDRLLLTLANHNLHHHTLDRYYCITMGWINWVTFQLKIYERLRRIKIYLEIKNKLNLA